jgi:predicted nuclease of predicted toxin-antitoxin system
MMRTLATELAPYAQRLTGPRIYADANVPAGIVEFMRQRLGWDVFYVLEQSDLIRAADIIHYRMARQLHRTLVTIDRDYLDDAVFPPGEGSGVVVVWAPNERLLTRMLAQVDRELFRQSGDSSLPLRGRKLLVEPGWTGDTAR